MPIRPMELDPNDPTRGLQTEWLLTNGYGGYAMGTALGVNTRRYHGLFIAATKPPVGRVVVLHSVVDQLIIGDEVIDLATQQFAGDFMLHPAGWRRMTCFHDQPALFSAWTYHFGTNYVGRGIMLTGDRDGNRACNLTYTVGPLDEPARLRVRPLMPLRDFHELDHEGMDGPSVLREDDKTIVVQRGDLAVSVRAPGGGVWTIEPQWWHGFAYQQDRDRGQEWIEDVWSPGVVEFPLVPGDQPAGLSLHCSLADIPRASRCPSSVEALTSSDEILRAAAGQFVVKRQVGDDWVTTILAGYPWFADWGRDTMIALPGLLLCTERYEEARSVLLAFARRIRRGLLPNVFSDYDDGAAYNTADASLWFVHVVREYARASGETDLEELLWACRAIIAGYRQGTDFGIRLCDDSLVTCGDGGHPVTWMDAKRGGIAFTPRDGKPVEINALWHNALCCTAELTDDEHEAAELRELAGQNAIATQMNFWWPERAGLHDVLLADRDGQPDGKLRPNQIFAVSLPFSPLTEEQQRAVVQVVRGRLLTPYGLRTLDPDDPGYCPRYEGTLMQRDGAYHNGTVWPWLIGPFCEAVLRVEQFSDSARNDVEKVIEPLLGELSRGCLNQIAEVYDGSMPHRESGCPAQAWSVAELLRIQTLLRDGI